MCNSSALPITCLHCFPGVKFRCPPRTLLGSFANHSRPHLVPSARRTFCLVGSGAGASITCLSVKASSFESHDLGTHNLLLYSTQLNGHTGEHLLDAGVASSSQTTLNMRPLRFVLLVACFIAIPVFLTCISLISRSGNDNADVFQRPQRSRLRALFSFSTPSALFPPSAVITLTTENSTFFLARPAAFGPSLPSKGLTGQLWIGRGFGDDRLLSEDELKSSGFELGCSDVLGWGDEQKHAPDTAAIKEPLKKQSDDTTVADQPDSQIASDIERVVGEVVDAEDGTDDHLHRPLPDSNPAPFVRMGEPADVNAQEKQPKPTHADIESLQESADIAGKIVMLSRGGCGFLEKVKWAQRRGGIALIVGDNERNGALTIMYAKGDTSNVTIPAIFTSYTSAHLLSSLVPPEELTDLSKVTTTASKESRPELKNKQKNGGPVFTTSTIAKATSTATSDMSQPEGGWMQNVLQAVGLDDGNLHGEDSRRPPGSGNIEWVQVKHWDEDEMVKTTSIGTQTSSTMKSISSSTRYIKQPTTTAKAGNDDFVIGVQDWRDTELIAPKSTSTAGDAKGKGEKQQEESTNTATALIGIQTNLKGGSIIPGSGEYQKPGKGAQTSSGDVSQKAKNTDLKGQGFFGRIKSWFCDPATTSSAEDAVGKRPISHPKHKDNQLEEGLWVTLTPTHVSTSPFFDTLLVLVISPLVTLTFVYGLLLLRSRIRRRRWRAPKSVVEQLPVRTYHTFSDSSTTTSSSLPTPNRSLATSPLLQARTEATVPIRSRQRSQTTTGVLSSSAPASSQSQTHSQSPPREKPRKQKLKRYKGRQVECVVCLEEYVDGESKVMSLPCGHEFHADCITPWLVNRRRTCPICKGDVVRSLQRSLHIDEDVDDREEGEETSDDVQDRAATTVNEEYISAIPILDERDVSDLIDEDQDVERGDATHSREQRGDERRPGGRWRGIIGASLSNLSGDTLWRMNTPSSNVEDRNR